MCCFVCREADVPAMSTKTANFTWADPEGEQGVRTPPPPLKNHKNIGFPGDIDPDPLKIAKLPSQHLMLDHHRHASEMPFKWRFAGGSMLVRIFWYLDPLSSHQQKKTNKKTLSKLDGPPLAKLSGSALVSEIVSKTDKWCTSAF